MFLRTRLKLVGLFAVAIAIVSVNLSETKAYAQDVLESGDCRGHCVVINGSYGCIAAQTSPFEGCLATTNICYYQVCF